VDNGSFATIASVTTARESGVRIVPTRAGLAAPGTVGARFVAVARLQDVPVGSAVRVTSGDVDLLLAHTDQGLVVVDDRCPHMSAPLSLGDLNGCVVDCPLHSGRFDLCTGETVQFPTTGGLDANGTYHAPWTPAGRDPKPEPTDLKARARALTRIRRLRYYPVRIVGDSIEVALPT
jgi:3-phenylpropionate/trans-cinnamate dioxygenase ferredoxin component